MCLILIELWSCNESNVCSPLAYSHVGDRMHNNTSQLININIMMDYRKFVIEMFFERMKHNRKQSQRLLLIKLYAKWENAPQKKEHWMTRIMAMYV